MKRKTGLQAFFLLLALLLVSVGIVPAVAATSEVPVEQPIPIVAANGQTSSGLHFVINEDVKETTSHWALFAADEQGQRNALNDLEMTQISDEKKQILSEGLRKIWAKYPVATIQRDGRTEVAFVSPGEHTLTEEEESILAQADEALAEYLNDKFSAENGIQWWAAPCHQDVTGTLPAESGEPALVIGDSMNVLIAGATSVSDIRASGIPEPEELNIPKGITRYDLVTFDHAALNKQIRGVLPLRVHGKEYQAELHRMDFEQIDDGIDSYEGVIVGVDGSDVLLTTGENALVGSVTFGNETFWITPVESRARAEGEASPLHVIYSSRDIENPEKWSLIDYGTLTPPEGYTPTEVPENLESSMRELQDQYATVNLLVVTDNQFYQDQDNWKTVAQDIVAEANRQFDRDDIRVALCVMAYTDSRRTQLSSQSDILSNPVAAFERVYPNSDLDLWASDLALYVGGYDADGSAQGLSYGYYPANHRHAWAQMVPDDLWYQGTTHGRRCVSIHELGHLFDTGHQDLDQNRTTPSYRRACQWFDPLPKISVTYSFFNEAMSTTEFSSDNYHGDADHDNARRIRETKWTVANYHS